MELPGALYEPTADGFEATALTIGPWDPGLQHAGPPAALLARAAERASGIAEGQTVRLTYDIFGPVPVGPVRISTSVVRPGRRVELVEAVLDAGDGRPLMRLSAWRMRTRSDDLPAAVPGSAPEVPHPAPAGPDAAAGEEAAFFRSDVAYHKALSWRFARGSFNSPGPATAWTRPQCTLVEGEPITPLQHLLVMTDAASGISAVLDWSSATFANVDLGVALHRPPRGEWLGMAATTVLGDSGAAQCSAVLFDAEGAVGRSTQSLFVEPR
ncbi:thioesterase family protein [Blastococcus sp. TML/M2B]|uniref:thioesterase family protein n=1 Tax=unclassified Blastococcus TaxID=2619396 RepID=UPI00190D91D3|nr:MULTISPECIES: thioesterase family protein [unclassified Blastococcus]MBN1094275.1 thioesterase family protein [Blastococcus sp. TML/M2B]MBN1095606.1 thioesterase family protein [Blastococcus sp. TML/C7B]